MNSYEEDVKKRIDKKEELPSKLDISTIKYLWRAGPFSGEKGDNVPKFLRKVRIFKNFNDIELMVLAKFLHKRIFNDKEVIFKQYGQGVGFYLVLSGHVEVVVEDKEAVNSNGTDTNAKYNRMVVSLDRYDYFGELALLQENSLRSASAITKGKCEILGIFRPDIEDLIESHPVIAAKLLQSISVIVADRLFSLTKEVGLLKYKIAKLEHMNEKGKRKE